MPKIRRRLGETMNASMKTLATNLSTQEISTAWQMANPIQGKDPNICRLDALGAIIKRNEYDKPGQYGWVVEYVLSPAELSNVATIQASPFVGCNLRILQYANYAASESDNRGIYHVRKVMKNDKENNQDSFQIADISQLGLNELQRTFGISNADMERLFPRV